MLGLPSRETIRRALRRYERPPSLGDLDPGTKEAFAEFIGRDPHPSGSSRAIFNISAPLLSQFRFEWHPQKRIVYLIHNNRDLQVGEAIAHHVETHGNAINAVQTFCRGYRKRAAEDAIQPHLSE